MIPGGSVERTLTKPTSAGGDSPPRTGIGGARWRSIGAFVLTVVLIASAAWYMNIHASQNEAIREAVGRGGYPMLLALSAASGFNLAVPIPIVAFFPFLLDAGFHPLGARCAPSHSG